jgi:hypothetical protein
MIGFNGEVNIGKGGIFGLDSQLPYVAIVEMYASFMPAATLWYAVSRYGTPACYERDGTQESGNGIYRWGFFTCRMMGVGVRHGALR